MVLLYRFNIDEDDGFVTVAVNASLNIDEGQTVFFLTVLADDGERIDTTLLEIQLLDVNDVAPVFNLGPTERQITIFEFDNLTSIQITLVTVSVSRAFCPLNIVYAISYSTTGWGYFIEG